MTATVSGISRDEFLSPDEVKSLCGSPKLNTQLGVLKEEGIPHKVIGRRVKISRFHVREWLAGKPVAPSRGGVKLQLVK
jgi:hypothetical protein